MIMVLIICFLVGCTEQIYTPRDVKDNSNLIGRTIKVEGRFKDMSIGNIIGELFLNDEEGRVAVKLIDNSHKFTLTSGAKYVVTGKVVEGPALVISEVKKA